MNATLEQVKLTSNGQHEIKHETNGQHEATRSTTYPAIDMNALGKAAKVASRKLALLNTGQKNAALHAIADELERQSAYVIAQNELDVIDAKAKGVAEAFLARMILNPKAVKGMADDTRNVASLPDPIGSEIESRLLANGIRVSRRRMPLGVLGVIYESRPNVTIDIATLAIKTSNAVILRGGSETLRSNIALLNVIHAALDKVGVARQIVQLIDNPDRGLITELLRLDKYVDMIIPRGGDKLQKLCKEQATIPVITGGVGIVHLYVDASADLQRAVDIIENSKVQKPSACNAIDTLLVHESVADRLLPPLAARLAQSHVELRPSGRAIDILQSNSGGATITPAGEGDFDREWLDYILSIKLVSGVDEALDHILEHGSEHTEAILTNDWNNAQQFINALSAAAIFVNASTRFNDGAQFGLGAEVAISTQKLHARGPMGLEALTSYKWIALGDGQIRP